MALKCQLYRDGKLVRMSYSGNDADAKFTEMMFDYVEVIKRQNIREEGNTIEYRDGDTVYRFTHEEYNTSC